MFLSNTNIEIISSSENERSLLQNRKCAIYTDRFYQLTSGWKSNVHLTYGFSIQTYNRSIIFLNLATICIIVKSAVVTGMFPSRDQLQCSPIVWRCCQGNVRKGEISRSLTFWLEIAVPSMAIHLSQIDFCACWLAGHCPEIGQGMRIVQDKLFPIAKCQMILFNYWTSSLQSSTRDIKVSKSADLVKVQKYRFSNSPSLYSFHSSGIVSSISFEVWHCVFIALCQSVK